MLDWQQEKWHGTWHEAEYFTQIHEILQAIVNAAHTTLGSGSGVSCESKANIACVYTEHGGVMRREQLTMTTRSLLGNIIHPTWLPPMIRHYDVTSNAIQLDPDVLFDADRIHCRWDHDASNQQRGRCITTLPLAGHPWSLNATLTQLTFI